MAAGSARAVGRRPPGAARRGGCSKAGLVKERSGTSAPGLRGLPFETDTLHPGHKHLGCEVGRAVSAAPPSQAPRVPRGVGQPARARHPALRGTAAGFVVLLVFGGLFGCFFLSCSFSVYFFFSFLCEFLFLLWGLGLVLT